MLNEAIGDLLPSAFAVALSPIPIVAVVLVLGAPQARTAGPAFAFGWIAGLLAVSVIVVLALGTGNDPEGDEAMGVDWFKVAIGTLFLLMAAGQWRKRPKNGQEPETPRWMATIDTATPQRAALLGVALSGASADPRRFRVDRRVRAQPSRYGDRHRRVHCHRLSHGRRLGACLPDRR